jgi:hypothetical protein
VYALQKIFQVIDVHWAEICSALPLIEALSEESDFPAADLAAAIASKCFYHLQEYRDAVRLAMCAGQYLDISVKSEYVDTILAHCIDEYKALRLLQHGGHQQEHQQDPSSVQIDPRMEAVIEQMFLRCYRDHCYEQAIGVALDTKRIDKVEEVVTSTDLVRSPADGFIIPASLCILFMVSRIFERASTALITTSFTSAMSIPRKLLKLNAQTCTTPSPFSSFFSSLFFLPIFFPFFFLFL